MEFYLTKQRGFSVLEVILSVSLLAMIVTPIISSYIGAREASALVNSRYRALLLVEEGIEAVRNIRDENFVNLTDGTHGLAVSENQWVFSGTEDVTDIFTRQITISTIDPYTKQAESTVTWRQNAQRTGSVTLTTRLSDWSRIVEEESNTFRVIEYFFGLGEFTGTTYDLILDEDLSEDYFVIIQGSDGNGSFSGTRGPDENYVMLYEDPWGTGDLAYSGASDILSFRRDNAVDSWVGVVTVAECLRDCAVSGFNLLDVKVLHHNFNDLSDYEYSGVNWSDIDQVMLLGGFNGAGCLTEQTGAAQTKACHVRIFPGEINRINWIRNRRGAAPLGEADSTVMVLEWGTEWTVQRVNVIGNNGGGGADSTREYETAGISPVPRENTWVWGTGYTNDEGIGDAAEGTLITLGDGVNQNTIESEVAVGQEYRDNKNFEVYALTHPDLSVNYYFKSDGNAGDLTLDISIEEAADSQNRMSLIYNGCNGTGRAYPRPHFSSRYIANDTIRLERRRSGQAWPAWIQGIDFSGIFN